MDSLYSNEIRRLFDAFRSDRCPTGLAALIAEEETHLQLILFRDNFNKFSGEDKRQIAAMVKEFMEKVRGMGVPIYLEVAKGDGQRAR